MPLGSRQYFDLAGPMSEYEDALMGLAGAQRSAQRMRFPQFLAGLGDLMRDWEQRKWQRSVQEQQMGMRERELDLGERRVGMMEPYYEAQTERLGRPDEPKNPFQVWRSRNPDAPVSDWIKLQQKPTTPTKPSESALQRAALTTPPSRTPLGRKIQLQQEGYRIDIAKDVWLSKETKRKEAGKYRDDPIYKSLLESIADNKRLQLRGGDLTPAQWQEAIKEADKTYMQILESTPDPELNIFFR